MAKYSKSSEETEKIFDKILENQEFVGIIENMVEGKSSSKEPKNRENMYGCDSNMESISESAIRSTLNNYILPDYMDGYNTKHDLLDELEDSYCRRDIVAKSDIKYYDYLQNNNIKKFEKIVSDEWDNTVDCIKKDG